MKSSVKKKDVRLTNICFNYDATNDSTFYVLLLYCSPATFFWHYTLDTDRWTLTFWERVSIAYFFCCYLVAHKRRCRVRRKIELLINRLYVFSAFSYIHHTTSLSTMSLFKIQCATRLNFIVTFWGWLLNKCPLTVGSLLFTLLCNECFELSHTSDTCWSFSVVLIFLQDISIFTFADFPQLNFHIKFDIVALVSFTFKTHYSCRALVIFQL